MIPHLRFTIAPCVVAICLMLQPGEARAQFLEKQAVIVSYVNSTGDHDPDTVIVDSRPGVVEHTASNNSFLVDLYDLDDRRAVIEIRGGRTANFSASPNKIRFKFPGLPSPAFESVALTVGNWPGMDSTRLTRVGEWIDLDFGGLKDNTAYSLKITVVNPVSPQPVLSIRTSHVELCWNTSTGRKYQLQYQSGAAGAWTNLAEPFTAVDTTTCSVQPIADTTRLYRVLVLP